MTLTSHYVTAEVFSALAGGAGGVAAIDQLAAAEHSKHLILLSSVVTESRAINHVDYPLAAEGYALLQAVDRQNSDVSEAVIRHPSVGAWALRTLIALRGGPALPGATPGGLRAIAAAAAIRAGYRTQITISALGGLAMLPSLGAAAVTDDTALVRSAADEASVGPVRLPADPHCDAPGWLGLCRVRSGPLDVLIDDLDPFRYPPAASLSAHTAEKPWAELLIKAWMVLHAHHPRVAAEVAATLRVITPLTTTQGHAESGSAPEVFGTVAMSLPTDAVSGAEALAHEIQHVKLGALIDQVPLTLPDDGSRYYAPWRPDPRPASGLLQGAYAYLGVSGFWRCQRYQQGYRERGDAEYARWRAATTAGVATLRSSGRLTTEGQKFVAGMARTLERWQHESVSATALARAEQATREHQARWQSAHGTAPSW